MNWKAAKTSASLCALFLVVYCATNWLASLRHNVPSYSFAWEHHIPFVPLMIVPYMSIDLFFIASPFFAPDDRARRTLAWRIAAAILIAGLCFLLFPMRFGFERPPVHGWLGAIFENFRALDRPFNQAPSLHIALGVILLVHYGGRGVPIAFAIRKEAKREYRTAASPQASQHDQNALATTLQIATWLWFALIMLSALLTYQHHLIDVITGFVLALLCFQFIPDEPLRRSSTTNLRVGLYYLVGAAFLTFGAFTAPPLTWLLLWPATSLALICTGYFGLSAGIFCKRLGRLPFSTRVLLAPVLLGHRISLAWYARQCEPWNRLTDQLWIGRRLSHVEAQQAIAQGVTAVLDFTAEFSEPRAFRELDYRQLPILDLTAPTSCQLEEAIRWIDEHAKTGIVYVHCKAGYSRTAAVAGAYLIANGNAATAEEAICMLRAARPSIVIRREVAAALRACESMFRPCSR